MRRLVLVFLFVCGSLFAARDRYASLDGNSSNDGSLAAPWDMWTALNPSGGNGPIPGDTVWIRGGTYSINFDCTANGTVADPIKYRQYPGEHVIIDGGSSIYPAITVKGSNLWFMEMEMFFSDTRRVSTQVDSNPTDIFRGMNISTDQTPGVPLNIKMINMIVHDGFNNFGVWVDATNAEVYGNIIYYSGWDAPDRGHGHGIYTQNVPASGTKRIEDNILFRAFSHGLHVYAQGDSISGYIIDGNISFDNGELSLTSGLDTNFRVSGENEVPQNITFTNNIAYMSPAKTRGQNVIGNALGCTNVTVSGNFFLTEAATALLKPAACASPDITMTGNTFLGGIQGFTTSEFPQNIYLTSAPTSGVQTFVRRNRYDQRRANIAILNWSGASSAAVDVSGVLSVGDTYVVRDAQNWFGPVVAQGTWLGGPLNLPLTLTAVATPVGNVPVTPTHTTSQFNAYVLLGTAGSGSGTPSSCSVVAPPTPPSSRVVVYPAGTTGVYDVTAYGATGNGTTDDTSAIKAAIAAALGAGVRNSTLYFPAGTYLVSDTLVEAEFGTTPTQMTANIAGGCITGVTITNGGAGFRATWQGGTSRGIYVYGGNGSGANLTASGGTSITGVNVPGGCSGTGYTVAPTVKGVNWRGYLKIQGHNQQDTIIKLKDNTFTNSTCSISNTAGLPQGNCRAVIYSGSEAEPNQYGSGENAYNNDIWDLTIDTGTGNTEAIGIDWIVSNKGSIQNVTVKPHTGSVGKAGINLSRNWNGSGSGPGLLRSVTVNGFDYGVYRDGTSTEVGHTIYDLTVTGQNIAGVFNRNLGMWIEKLSSSNSVPAVVNQDNANMAIVDGVLNGGSGSVSAIYAQGVSKVGQLWARNITTTGYQAAIRQGVGTTTSSGANVTGQNVTEYSSSTAVNLWSTSPANSLGLPIEDTPAEYVNNDFAQWAIVNPTGGDDTTTIQAALNSGKPVVFFPGYNYKISNTLSIPSGVRKLVGRGLPFFDTASGGSLNVNPLSCDATTGGSVTIQNLQFSLNFTPTNRSVVHNCAVPLIITGLRANGILQTASGTGKLYMEDIAISGPVTLVTNGSTWIRQNNVENGTACSLCVSGGHKLWSLGYKTEEANNAKMLSVTGSSYAELLGIFNSVHQVWAGPAYYVVDSQFSMAAMTAYAQYTQVVSETRAGVTRTLAANNNWVGGGSSSFALFTAY